MPDPTPAHLSGEYPSFPPLLSGRAVDPVLDPQQVAIQAVTNNEAGAGDLFWSLEEKRLAFTLILEPEIPKKRCFEMLYTLMVAFGDAAGAVIPPEISITYSWPSSLMLNGAEVGYVDLLIPPQTDEEKIPNWLALSLDIQIHPEKFDQDPGKIINKTTFWDEGCGTLSRTDLLNSISRHFLTWLHTWQEDGFEPIHRGWLPRSNSETEISLFYNGKSHTGKFLGLDETGNMLLRSGKSTEILQTEIALQSNRDSVKTQP